MLIAGTGSPLSWMTTWKGNTYWFSADGSSYVAYRVIAGVALTTGDPVGPPDRMRTAIEEFAEFASSNGWIPCFYSVTDDARSITDSMGWSGLQVAEETVLDLGQVAFTGKRFQDVRTALNRAKKSGITAEWISFPHAPLAIKDQIVAISEEWVADKGMPEMGFTLGGLDEVDDEQVRCLIAVDEDRTVHGVTSWLPVYRDGKVVGWTLDFMRRRSEGFRPAMEFLIASAALKLEEEGVEFLSLSGAPLATIAGDSERNANETGGHDFLGDDGQRARPTRSHPGTGLRISFAVGLQIEVPASVRADAHDLRRSSRVAEHRERGRTGVPADRDDRSRIQTCSDDSGSLIRDRHAGFAGPPTAPNTCRVPIGTISGRSETGSSMTAASRPNTSSRSSAEMISLGTPEATTAPSRITIR